MIFLLRFQYSNYHYARGVKLRPYWSASLIVYLLNISYFKRFYLILFYHFIIYLLCIIPYVSKFYATLLFDCSTFFLSRIKVFISTSSTYLHKMSLHTYSIKGSNMSKIQYTRSLCFILKKS